jgi:hypothetical protein
MDIGKYLSNVFECSYLIEKIKNLKKTKGIESDLRFLFEKSIYKYTGIIPETEVGNRTDLKLSIESEPTHWIEMKCYEQVLTRKDTQTKIKEDLKSLSTNSNDCKKIFVYFGLFGNHQPPKADTFDKEKREEEINKEIKKIEKIASENSIKIEKRSCYKKELLDRTIYVVWFYVE